MELTVEMIKRNEAAKRAGEMGIEYDMSNITTSKPDGFKYHSTAGNDKAVPTGTNIETTVKDAEGDVSLSGIEQRHMLMQRLSRAPQESFSHFYQHYPNDSIIMTPFHYTTNLTCQYYVLFDSQSKSR